ncbi:MAG TPA: LysM domain-containing protein [Solirubrobacterales bacterium]
MKKPTTALARVVAFTALVAAFLVVVVVVSNSLKDNGSGSGRHARSGEAPKHRVKIHTPPTYVIQNGDTLTAIAHKTGVSVVRIETLNPEVDPQILISGQKLKLR